MLRVLEECDAAAADFQPDPVHDLRVALRRCRSLADGIMAIDPDPEWKAMKKAGKRLFQSLGALRDVQIMMDWIERLDLSRAASPDRSEPEGNSSPAPTDASPSPSDPAHVLLQILQHRESEQKHQARAALDDFDRKQWRRWSDTLPRRAAQVRLGSAVFLHLALERWTAARELHVRAMRTRSQVALHTLRIGIKRFRYIVENFLPEQHKLWGNDLKHLQDLLGEIHDLDVLWATALQTGVLTDPRTRSAWHERILAEREQRVEEYRGRATGKKSLWELWRAGLPQGAEIHKIATQRMKLWAKALDPDFAHSERVAKLALQLYDGLEARGILSHSPRSQNDHAGTDARASLHLGALLHDVGKARGIKGHHKRSLELIKAHGTPLGWKAEDVRTAALLARFHCGALPRPRHKLLRDLLRGEQRNVIRLSAILRLANALDAEHDGRTHGLKIANAPTKTRSNGFLHKPPSLGKDEALIVAADGFADGTPTARAVAAERYLLESVLRRPVIVRAVPRAQSSAPARRSTSPVRKSA